MPVLGFVFEQFMQWKFGMAGAVAAVLFLVGLRTRSETCQCVGIVLLVVLLA